MPLSMIPTVLSFFLPSNSDYNSPLCRQARLLFCDYPVRFDCRLVLPYSKYDHDTWVPSSIEYGMINQSVDRDSTPPVEWVLYSENAFVISVTSADYHQRLPWCPQKNRSAEVVLRLSLKTRFIEANTKPLHRST